MSRKNAIKPLMNRNTNFLERRTTKIAMRAGREAMIAQATLKGVMQHFAGLTFMGRMKLLLRGIRA